MVHLPIDVQVSLSPRLVDLVRTTNTLTTTERLWLAKALLDSLVTDEAQQPTAESSTELSEQVPTIAEVVAEIKATPPNPNQIQHATKTVDEVLAEWEESETDEPPLTTEEWEQHWWTIRQMMKHRDQRNERTVE